MALYKKLSRQSFIFLKNLSVSAQFSHEPTDEMQDALECFDAREQNLLSLFKQCYTMRDLTRIQAQIMRTGFSQHVFVIGRIISFCSVLEQGSMDHAISVFREIKWPDGFLYNTMIRGFGRTGRMEEAFSFYTSMRMRGKAADNFTFAFLLKICAQSTAVELGKQVHCCTVKQGLESHIYVKNTLIHMYSMFKDMEEACQVFEAIPSIDLVSWNSLIDGYVNCKMYKEAKDMFLRMRKSGFTPDEATLVVVLSACSELGELDFGRWVHSNISSSALSHSVSVLNSLIDMYAKCGAIDKALGVFEALEERNTVSWNAIIVGLAMNGRAGEALRIFNRMHESDEHHEPNDITFVGILCACSHGGLVEEGRRYFISMQKDYGITPTIRHYGCMVDLLGRAGLVREAYELVRSMPMESNAVIWRTLLGACRVHGDLELGEKARKHLEVLEPDHSSDYVLISHMHASKDHWNDVFDAREAMRERGLQKPQPGNCLINILPSVTW